MSNYYEKRDAKVRLCEELSNRGWKIYGYKKDESDSMTDYYSPANWDGIATKNGYVLVIDNYSNGNSGKALQVYNKNYVAMTSNDKNKIEALQNMTQAKGATEGEENNAKVLIEKIQDKYKNQKATQWETVGYYPQYMANSKGNIWHIEKDNALVDKGNQLTIFADIPESYMFDINTMQYKDSYKTTSSYNYETGEYERVERTLTESQTKAIKALKTFILRIERAVNGMTSCGDGTAETEKTGLEQQSNETMEKVIERKIKKVTKPVKIERTEIEINDILSFSYHGHYWIVTNIWINANGKKCVDYECLGSASRGYQRIKNTRRYYQLEERLVKEFAENKTSLYVMQEVEEVTEVEKWVKVKTNNKNTYETKETVKTEKENVNNDSIDYTITEDEHTKTHEKLYVVKFVKTLSKDDFKTLSINIKSIGGYYSSFKGGFIFKEEPTELLKSIYIINNNDIIKENETHQEKNINKEQPKEKDYTKLIEKVNSQLETNNKRINHLEGDFKTNTWKRMREQDSRDSERRSLLKDSAMLNYIIDRCSNRTLTAFEECLISKTFRNEMYSYYIRNKDNRSNKVEISYPEIKTEYGKDNWYNVEVPKKQKRLNKANIYNTNDLLKAIELYNNIIDYIEGNNTIDLKAEQIKKLEREYKMQQKGDINFTSNKELLESLINYSDIKEDEKILEPSAGIGNIADYLKQYNSNIDVCEYMYSYAELLKLKGYNVLCNDFMELNSYNSYDKIVMNPPFSKETEHIKHAYSMLKNNGKIVSITSNHWTFANDKESIDFRNWLNSLDYEVYDVEEGKFEFTNVACKILIVNKNEAFEKAM